jgi:4-amino-4-deoxy-L-arabinose transferase-like glycosyltransferase
MVFLMRIFFLFIGVPLAVFSFFFFVFPFFRKSLEKIDLKFFKWLFIAILVFYIILVSVYLFSRLYLDPISPSLISTSVLFTEGKEIYRSPTDPFVYSLLYGPIAYVVNGFFLFIFGASIFSSKVGSIISLLLSFCFIFYSLKKYIKKENMYVFFGFVSSLFLLFWTFSFEARVDVMALLFSSFALFGATRKKEIPSLIIVGIAMGLGINLKISGLFYFLPALFLLWDNFKMRSVFFSCGVAAISAILPFFVFSNINLGNYLLWLGLVGKHGLEGGSFANNIGYMVFLFLPFLPLFSKKNENGFQKNVFYLGVLGISVLVTSVFAAKVGSGQNHLLPFIPFFVYGYGIFYFSQEWEKDKDGFLRLVLPFVAVLILISSITMIRVFRLYSIFPVRANNDLNYIIEKYKTPNVYMGYGESSGDPNLYANVPSLRPVLLFSGKNYLLDKAAFADFREAGGVLSPDFFENFKKCTDDVWIFPKGTKPFEGILGYGKLLFDEGFVKTFRENFDLRESTEYLDVWRCKDALSSDFKGDSTIGTSQQNF